MYGLRVVTHDSKKIFSFDSNEELMVQIQEEIRSATYDNLEYLQFKVELP